MIIDLLKVPPKVKIKQFAEHTPPKSIRVWGRMVSELYNDSCIVTGLKKSEVAVEKHHIYNVFDYPELKLSIFNGIILTRELHLMFHKFYGTKVTADDLLAFLTVLKKTEYNKYSERIEQACNWVEFLKKNIKKNIEN